MHGEISCVHSINFHDSMQQKRYTPMDKLLVHVQYMNYSQSLGPKVAMGKEERGSGIYTQAKIYFTAHFRDAGPFQVEYSLNFTRWGKRGNAFTATISFLSQCLNTSQKQKCIPQN